MTNEEIVIRIKAGESNLIDTLWSQVHKFVYKQACQFYNRYTERCLQTGLEVDDLYQEGFLAIYSAIDVFDGDRNKTFLTYAGYHIKHRFFEAAKMHPTGWQNDTTYYAQSLDAPAYTENEETSLLDTLADPENVEDSIVDSIYTENLSKDLCIALRPLRDGWQEVIHEIYYNGLKPVDLAKRLGVTRAVVSTKHRKALVMLSTSPILQAHRV